MSKRPFRSRAPSDNASLRTQDVPPAVRAATPAATPDAGTALMRNVTEPSADPVAQMLMDQHRAIATWVYDKTTGVAHINLARCASLMREGVEALGDWIGNAAFGTIAVKQHRDFIASLEPSAKRELQDFLIDFSCGRYDDRPVLYPPEDDGIIQQYVVDVLAWAAIVRGVLVKHGRLRADDGFLRDTLQFAHGTLCVLRYELRLSVWCYSQMAISVRDHGLAPEIAVLNAMLAGGGIQGAGRRRSREDADAPSSSSDEPSSSSDEP
jgi:hypothetical protein